MNKQTNVSEPECPKTRDTILPFLVENSTLISQEILSRMVLGKLADGRTVSEEEVDLLLDLVGLEVGLISTHAFEALARLVWR